MNGNVTSNANSELKCMLRCMNEKSINCLRVQYYPMMRRCDLFQTWNPFGVVYNPFTAFFTLDYLGPCKVFQKVGICRPDFMIMAEWKSCISLRMGSWQWSDARDVCNALNDAFPAIGNTSDLFTSFTYWIQQSLTNPFYSPCLMQDNPTSTRIWLGGQRANPNSASSPFNWKPNSRESYSNGFNNWGFGQPTQMPFPVEGCLSVFTYPSTQWDDAVCSYPKCVLCQAIADVNV